MRSRTKWLARGLRTLTFLVRGVGAGSSPPASGSASSDSSSACCAFQSSSNRANCSLESCSLLRLRWASNNSRSRLRYLSFSVLSCWSCAANSPTILRSALASSGSELRSIGGTCFQHKRNDAAFQEKTRVSGNVLLITAPIALPPCGCAQIDAAQQRSQFLCGDLPPAFCGALTERYGVGPFLQPFTPHSKAVTIPVQNLHPVPTPTRKHKQVSGEGIQLQVLADQRVQTVEALAHIARRQA